MSHFFSRSVLVGSLVLSCLAVADSKGSMSKGMVEIPKDEKAFLERMHHTNQREVKLGNLASTKASSQAVKDFAQQMVTDHQAADDKLTAMAKTRKLTLGEPKPINDTEKRMMEKHKSVDAALQSLDGPMFDAAYMATMLGDHDANILKVQTGLQQFTGSEVAPMLTETLTRLTSHRDHAYQVLGQIKPTATGVGGSGSTGSGSGGMGSMGGTGGMGSTGSMGGTGSMGSGNSGSMGSPTKNKDAGTIR